MEVNNRVLEVEIPIIEKILNFLTAASNTEYNRQLLCKLVE